MKARIIPRDVCCRLMDESGTIDGKITVRPEMLLFCGREAEIISCWPGYFRQGDKITRAYTIDLDSGKFVWLEELFDTKMRFKI